MSSRRRCIAQTVPARYVSFSAVRHATQTVIGSFMRHAPGEAKPHERVRRVQLAVQREEWATARNLVERCRIPIDACDILNEKTPLIDATVRGHHAGMRFVLGLNANPHISCGCPNNYPALHYAALRLDQEAADILVRAGANPYVRSADDQNAFDVLSQFESSATSKEEPSKAAKAAAIRRIMHAGGCARSVTQRVGNRSHLLSAGGRAESGANSSLAVAAWLANAHRRSFTTASKPLARGATATRAVISSRSAPRSPISQPRRLFFWQSDQPAVTKKEAPKSQVPPNEGGKQQQQSPNVDGASETLPFGLLATTIDVRSLDYLNIWAYGLTESRPRVTADLKFKQSRGKEITLHYEANSLPELFAKISEDVKSRSFS